MQPRPPLTRGYDAEYHELARGLQVLTRQQYNGRNLFSTNVTDTFDVRHGDGEEQTSTLLAPISIKADFKQIIDAGLKVSDGNGGLEFVNIMPATTGTAIRAGGQIAKDDAFQYNIVMVSNLSQGSIATQSDEAASDTANAIREV